MVRLRHWSDDNTFCAGGEREPLERCSEVKILDSQLYCSVQQALTALNRGEVECSQYCAVYSQNKKAYYVLWPTEIQAQAQAFLASLTNLLARHKMQAFDDEDGFRSDRARSISTTDSISGTPPVSVTTSILTGSLRDGSPKAAMQIRGSLRVASSAPLYSTRGQQLDASRIRQSSITTSSQTTTTSPAKVLDVSRIRQSSNTTPPQTTQANPIKAKASVLPTPTSPGDSMEKSSYFHRSVSPDSSKAGSASLKATRSSGFEPVEWASNMMSRTNPSPQVSKRHPENLQHDSSSHAQDPKVAFSPTKRSDSPEKVSPATSYHETESNVQHSKLDKSWSPVKRAEAFQKKIDRILLTGSFAAPEGSSRKGLESSYDRQSDTQNAKDDKSLQSNFNRQSAPITASPAGVAESVGPPPKVNEKLNDVQEVKARKSAGKARGQSPQPAYLWSSPKCPELHDHQRHTQDDGQKPPKALHDVQSPNQDTEDTKQPHAKLNYQLSHSDLWSPQKAMEQMQNGPLKNPEATPRRRISKQEDAKGTEEVQVQVGVVVSGPQKDPEVSPRRRSSRQEDTKGKEEQVIQVGAPVSGPQENLEASPRRRSFRQEDTKDKEDKQGHVGASASGPQKYLGLSQDRLVAAPPLDGQVGSISAPIIGRRYKRDESAHVTRMTMSELPMQTDAFDPSCPILKAHLLQNLGMSRSATIESLQDNSGAFNDGVWIVSGGLSSGLVLKLVPHQQTTRKTDQEKYTSIQQQCPKILSEYSVAFPLKILQLIGPDGDRYKDLLVMRQAPGLQLTQHLYHKFNGGLITDLLNMFEEFGRFLKTMHQVYRVENRSMQHGDCQPSNVFYDEVSAGFTLIDVADFGFGPYLAQGGEDDVEHFVEGLSSLQAWYGQSLIDDCIDKFREGYGVKPKVR
mmetsp:Transcript_20688/g.32959  ORF Transcript_20688/g.32959 Transcript_20688/m.32959 type:complete len:910 (+) Transcript_20688:47-2776(+)